MPSFVYNGNRAMQQKLGMQLLTLVTCRGDTVIPLTLESRVSGVRPTVPYTQYERVK